MDLIFSKTPTHYEDSCGQRGRNGWQRRIFLWKNRLFVVAEFSGRWDEKSFMGRPLERPVFLALKRYLQELKLETESAVGTLNTACSIIWSPFLPGYFPAMLAADRLNRLAPVSVQMAWTSIFFPTPDGPANSSDFTRGAFSCTVAEPAKGRGSGSSTLPRRPAYLPRDTCGPRVHCGTSRCWGHSCCAWRTCPASCTPARSPLPLIVKSALGSMGFLSHPFLTLSQTHNFKAHSCNNYVPLASCFVRTTLSTMKSSERNADIPTIRAEKCLFPGTLFPSMQ